MITSIKFINTSITSHSYHLFLVVRTLKMYSVSKFQVCCLVRLIALIANLISFLGVVTRLVEQGKWWVGTLCGSN